MSVYNYNHFNTTNPNNNSSNYTVGNFNPVTTTDQNISNIDRALGLASIQQRARERIELDPFKAVRSRARELKEEAGLFGNIYARDGLQEYRNLLTEYYAVKFRAGVATKATLWQQRVGSIEPNNYLNPAVIEQIRQSFAQGRPVSSFMPGGLNDRRVRDSLKVFTPEMAAAVELLERQQGNVQTQKDIAKYYSRPGVKDYTDLFLSGDSMRGVFFQFQNTQLIANIMNSGKGFDVLTQTLNEKAFEHADNTKINILAGNELAIAVTSDSNGTVASNQNVYGIESDDSFHPKLGYIPSKTSQGMRYELAFISTQNMTPALSTNKTIESLLVLNSGSTIATEREAAREIINYTDYLIDNAITARTNNQSFDAKQLDFNNINLQNRKYLYLQGGVQEKTEIADKYYDLINKAATSTEAINNNHKVVISMSELTATGFIGTEGANARLNMLKLASEGRLVVALDKSTVEQARTQYQDTFNFYQELAKKGALRIVPTDFLHEKTISIFDGNNRLITQSIGSANISGKAMSGKENTEANIIFTTGIYNTVGTDNIETQKQLDKIQGFTIQETESEFSKHIDFISGGKFRFGKEDISQTLSGAANFDGHYMYTTGYKAEMPSEYLIEENIRIQRIKQLESDITRNNVSAMTGIGNIDVEYRYAPEARSQFVGLGNDVPNALEPVGLRVNIKSPEGAHQISIDLTVTTEGNVVVSDLNKALSSSLYVNNSNEEQILFGNNTDPNSLINKRVLRPGESVKLNSYETALAYINTLQREFVHQSEYVQKDIYFNARLAMEDYTQAVNIAQDVLAEQFRNLMPEYKLMQDTQTGRTSPANFASIIYDISRRSEADRERVLTAVSQRMINTSFAHDNSVFEVDTSARNVLMADLFRDISDGIYNNMTETDVYQYIQAIGERFVELLYEDADTGGEKKLADLRGYFISKDDRLRAEYMSMAKTQSRAFAGDLLAPFISAHESTYDAFQAKSRTAVFGESVSFSNRYNNQNIATFFSQGLLNPLEYGHATLLGEAGSYWRALGSSSVGDPLSVPHLGGLKQLSLVDSDISSGAGVVHDYDMLAGSVSNLRKITKESFIQELQAMGLNNYGSSLDALFKATGNEQGEDVALMYSSFSKAERLTQRIKNIVGSRAAIDLNKEYLSEALSTIISDKSFYDYYGLNAPTQRKTTGRVNDSPERVIAGKLRVGLSSQQMSRVREVRQMIADERYRGDRSKVSFEEVENYFKKELVNLNNIEHGFIGPEEMRRIGLQMGTNLFSDPNYMNESYKYLSGSVHRVRDKLNLNDYDIATDAQERLMDIFNRQGIVTTQHFKGEDGKIYLPGFYIRDDDGNIKQVAQYTDDGFLEFNDIFKTKGTSLGSRNEKAVFKMPAFAKRAEGGFSIVRGLGTNATTSRGMNILEFDVLTVKRPDTGNRPAGGDGLFKGPFVVKEADWFTNKLDKVFLDEVFANAQEKKQFETLMNVKGDQKYEQVTFGLMSPKNIKGYAIRGGISMVGSTIQGVNDPRSSSFVALYEQSGIDVAKSLAFMFMGNADVRQAMASLIDDPIKKMAMLNPAGKVDISETSKHTRSNESISNLVLSASGFLGLSGTATDLSLRGLRQQVISALQGDLTAAANLKARAQQLLLSARQSGEQYGQEIEITSLNPEDQGRKYKLKEQVQLDDHNGLVRAASIYATMTLMKTQLLAERDVAERLQNGTKFTTNELPLNLVEFYHGLRVEKDVSGQVIVNRNINQSIEGYSAEQYKNVLNLIQGHLGQDLISINRYFDSNGNIISGQEDELYEAYLHNSFLLNSIERTIGRGPVVMIQAEVSMSQSLVPAGMKDSVKFEYSSYNALSGERLQAFREPLGLENNQLAKNVQHSYFMLLGLLDGNLYSTIREDADARAGFKLGFVNDANPNNLIDGHYNAFLSYEELDMIALAMKYPKSEGANGSTREALQDMINFHEQRRAGNVTSNTMGSISEYINTLNGNKGMLPSQDYITYANNRQVTLSGVNRFLLDGINRRQQGETNIDYVGGLVELESALLKEMSNLNSNDPNYQHKLNYLSGLRRNIYTSKNILLPSLRESVMDNGSGLRRVTVNAFSDTNHGAIGMLLGTDILAKISMVFGDHKSEIITTQTDFINKYMKAQPILDKILKQSQGGSVLLNDDEVQVYRDLMGAANLTYKAVATLIESDVTRQAFGDHESFKGSVGIPANTFLLNPWEMVVGDRALRLAGDSKKPEIGDLIDRYVYQSVTSRLDSSSTRHDMISTLINTYTVRLDGSTLHTVTASDITQIQINDRDLVNQNLLERVYADIYNNANKTSITPVQYTTPDQIRSLSINERKMLLTAKIYSNILDLGDNTEYKILRSLMADSIDLKRTGTNLPTSWQELLDNNLLVKEATPKYTMDRLVQLSLGVISQRTGHPGGASTSTNENDNYILMEADRLRERRIALGQVAPDSERGYYDGAQFVAASSRMSTGMLVPSVSRFLSMLGDYDGDSHRIIVNKTERILAEINRIQGKTDRFKETINRIDNLDFDKLKLSYTTSRQDKGKYLVNRTLEYFEFYNSQKKRDRIQNLVDRRNYYRDLVKDSRNNIQSVKNNARQKVNTNRQEIALKIAARERFENYKTVIFSRNRNLINEINKQVGNILRNNIKDLRLGNLNRLNFTDLQGNTFNLLDRAETVRFHELVQERISRGQMIANKQISQAEAQLLEQRIHINLELLLNSAKARFIKRLTEYEDNMITILTNEIVNLETDNSNIRTNRDNQINIIEQDITTYLSRIQALQSQVDLASRPEGMYGSVIRDVVRDMTNVPTPQTDNFIGPMTPDELERRRLEEKMTFDAIKADPNLSAEFASRMANRLVKNSKRLGLGYLKELNSLGLNVMVNPNHPNYQANLQQAILGSLDNINNRSTFREVDKFRGLNQLNDIVGVLESSILRDPDFRGQNYINYAGITKNVHTVIDEIGLYKALMNAGEVIHSNVLRRPSSTEPLSLPLVSDNVLNSLKIKSNLLSTADANYLGSHRYDTYRVNVDELGKLLSHGRPMSIGDSDALASYRQQLSIIQNLETGVSTNFIDYSRQNKDNFAFRSITDFNNLHSRQELTVQTALFQQQMILLEQAMDHTNNMTAGKERQTYKSYLELERERLIQQQATLVDNLNNFAAQTLGVSKENALSELIDSMEFNALALRETLDRKVTDREQEEQELQNQLSSLMASRRILESRNTDDIRKFVKMYTGLPGFIFEARGSQEEMDLGKAASLLSQKFSLDGVKDMVGDNKYEQFMTRTGLMLHMFEHEGGIQSTGRYTQFVSELANLDLSDPNDLAFAEQLYIDLESRLSGINEGDVNKFNLSNQSLSKASFELSNPSAQNTSNLSANDRRRLEIEGFANELKSLGQSLRAQGADRHSYEAAIMQHYGMTFNYATAFGDIWGDMLKKASGETLDPFEFESAIRAIGEGGSKLIGSAYNTLIPLLDQTMINAPFAIGSTRQGEIFRSRIQDIDLMLQGSNLSQDEINKLTTDRHGLVDLATQLGVNLNDQVNADGTIVTNAFSYQTQQQLIELETNKERIESRFYNTVGVVSSFQQIVRDALKPPGAGGVNRLFSQRVFNLPIQTSSGETFEPASLSDILSWTDSNYSKAQQDEIRQKTLRKFLGMVLGTQLETDYGTQDPNIIAVRRQQAISNLGVDDNARSYLQSVEGQDWIQNLTGFGAMMMLTDYTKTKDGDFFSKFVENSDDLYGFTKDDFESWLNKTHGPQIDTRTDPNRDGYAKEYVKTRIIDLMQRTQAGFAAESIRSASPSNPSDIMERAYNVFNNSSMAQGNELLPYQDILERYSEIRQGASGAPYDYNQMSKRERQSLDYMFMKEVLTRKLQTEHASTGAFTGDSIDYLRDVATDLNTIQEQGTVDATTAQLLSVAGHNNAVARMRRGKLGDMREAMSFGQFSLRTIVDVLDKANFNEDQLIGLLDPSQQNNLTLDNEQATAASMLIGLTKQMGLSQDQQRLFVETLVSRQNTMQNGVNVQGEMRAATFAQDAGFMSQLLNIVHETGTSQERSGDSWHVRHQQLNNTLNYIFGGQFGGNTSGPLPTHRVQQLVNANQSFTQQINTLQSNYQQLTNQNTVQGQPNALAQRQGILNANYAAEGVGIFASPLLFAMAAGNKMKADERITTFAIDTIQGLAEMSSSSQSVTRQYLNNYSAQANAFSRARMRQAMAVEGLMAGSVQAIGQELMYRSISGIAGGVVRGVMGRSVRSNPNIATVGSALAAEVVGSVLAQGVTRAMFDVKGSRTSAPAESSLTRMLASYIEDIWKAAEDAQLEQITAEYIVMDTDDNMQLDFDVDSNPGESWFDIESGILIVDDSGSPIEAEFEEGDNGYLTTAGSARLQT